MKSTDPNFFHSDKKNKIVVILYQNRQTKNNQSQLKYVFPFKQFKVY